MCLDMYSEVIRCDVLFPAPKKVITGAFNIRFAFPKDVALTQSDIIVMPIEGDALGHVKDTFGGSGANYHLLCYIPDARKGKSRISVVKGGVDVTPVIIEYDTVHTGHRDVGNTGSNVVRKVEIPVSVDVPIRNLKKQNFQVSYPDIGISCTDLVIPIASLYRRQGTGLRLQFQGLFKR